MEFCVIIGFLIVFLLWIATGIVALMKHEDECATHGSSAPNLKYCFWGFLMFSSLFRKKMKICDK